MNEWMNGSIDAAAVLEGKKRHAARMRESSVACLPASNQPPSLHGWIRVPSRMRAWSQADGVDALA